MKVLRTSGGVVIGAFNYVDVEASGLVCDGVVYGFATVGADYTLTDADLPPAPPAIEVPQTVTMRQARLALLAAGKLTAVDAAIAALPSPMRETAQIEWEFSSLVERHRQLVATLAPALGLNEAGIDALFVDAGKR